MAYQANFSGLFQWNTSYIREIIVLFVWNSLFFCLSWTRWILSDAISSREKKWTRWFNMTFWSPSWRSLNAWKGQLTIPKRSQRIAREGGDKFLLGRAAQKIFMDIFQRPKLRQLSCWCPLSNRKQATSAQNNQPPTANRKPMKTCFSSFFFSMQFRASVFPKNLTAFFYLTLSSKC